LEEIDLGGRQVIRIGNAESNGTYPSSVIFLVAEDGGLASLVATGIVLDEAMSVAESFMYALADVETR
jgi:hypothetical protein